MTAAEWPQSCPHAESGNVRMFIMWKSRNRTRSTLWAVKMVLCCFGQLSKSSHLSEPSTLAVPLRGPQRETSLLVLSRAAVLLRQAGIDLVWLNASTSLCVLLLTSLLLPQLLASYPALPTLMILIPHYLWLCHSWAVFTRAGAPCCHLSHPICLCPLHAFQSPGRWSQAQAHILAWNLCKLIMKSD